MPQVLSQAAGGCRAHPDAHGGEAAAVRQVRDAVCPPVQPALARAHARQGQALQVPHAELRDGLHDRQGAVPAQAHAQRPAALLQVPGLLQDLQDQGDHAQARAQVALGHAALLLVLPVPLPPRQDAPPAHQERAQVRGRQAAPAAVVAAAAAAAASSARSARRAQQRYEPRQARHAAAWRRRHARRRPARGPRAASDSLRPQQRAGRRQTCGPRVRTVCRGGRRAASPARRATTAATAATTTPTELFAGRVARTTPVPQRPRPERARAAPPGPTHRRRCARR
mmetsp:Transcript_9037/g.28806  ORF Transcript_9037/g.28806 Transcript_9037/m.28806 type:complete len:283 (-) Transcript_9037:864-1712(-)